MKSNTKRIGNTQGVLFTLSTTGNLIKGLQLNNNKRFSFVYDYNHDTLVTICNLLDSIDEIYNYSIIVNNSKKIDGYLFSIDYKGNSFHDLKDFIK